MHKIRIAALYGLIFLASLIVVLLSLNVRSLRMEVRDATFLSATLQTGAFVPLVETVSTIGTQVRLGGEPGRDHLYVVYTVTCPYCRQSVPAWKELYEAAESRGESVMVIGVSTDSDSALSIYDAEHGLPFPSVSLEDQRLVSLYRFGVVPQILVVDSTGRITYSRRGTLLRGASTDSILRHLGIATVSNATP